VEVWTIIDVKTKEGVFYLGSDLMRAGRRMTLYSDHYTFKVIVVKTLEIE